MILLKKNPSSAVASDDPTAAEQLMHVDEGFLFIFLATEYNLTCTVRPFRQTNKHITVNT